MLPWMLAVRNCQAVDVVRGLAVRRLLEDDGQGGAHISGVRVVDALPRASTALLGS